ncbi:MAG: ABC transporter substrate-binding protein [Candidatus Limiplasma sp.]|nr:ABC transporter substrate-binding protein [Candidatus Limiplasma sp.]
MKRWLAVLLAVGILCVALPAVAEKTEQNGTTVVACSTPMSGLFFTDMWGNNTIDANIRALLHGYGTVAWDPAGVYSIDATVVTNLTAVENARGDRTYTFTLADGLTYNDGTPITAADYVFAVLLQSNAVIPALGGINTGYAALVGYTAYAAGQTDVFSGVRLLDAHRFSLTVSHTALPYFYELTLVNVIPCPPGVLAPGYTVLDAGEGAYLAMPDPAQPNAEVPAKLTQAVLEKTLTAPDGYLHHPRVTSGPYQLDAYNAEEHEITLTINPAYLGDAQGQKPTLARIRLVNMGNADALDAYQAGTVQIIHKMIDADTVAKARQLQVEDKAQVSNYMHSGYTFLAFACEQAPTDDVAVRQALALCLDRNAFCAELFRSNALPVYGYYGFGQWMTMQNTQALADYEIGYDLEAARALLVKAGYTYNEKGETYQEGKRQVRCKIDGGALVPLELRWAKAPSATSDYALTQLKPAAEALGMRLTVTEMSFSEMLDQYFRVGGTRDYNLFFLTENFLTAFDPYSAYQTGDAWQGSINTSGLRDTKLMNAAEAMNSVTPGDTETYVKRWFAFQERWRQMMPTAPVCCNVYFDVCPTALYGYAENAPYGLARALLYATDQPPVEVTATPTATAMP